MEAEQTYQRELKTDKGRRRVLEFKTEESDLLSKAARYGNIFETEKERALEGKDYDDLNTEERLEVLRKATKATEYFIASSPKATLISDLTRARPGPPLVPAPSDRP